MAYNEYITLTNSNASLSKQFRVLQDGYAPIREKMSARRLTVTGKVDNQTAPVKQSWRYVLLIYHTDPSGAAWGTLDNLKTFFGYVDPQGTPTNVITFVDFDTTSYDAYLVGSLSEKPFGPMIDGQCAVFSVPIELVEADS